MDIFRFFDKTSARDEAYRGAGDRTAGPRLNSSRKHPLVLMVNSRPPHATDPVTGALSRKFTKRPPPTPIEQSENKRPSDASGHIPCLYSHISTENRGPKQLQPLPPVVLGEKTRASIQELCQDEKRSNIEQPALSADEAKFTTGRKRSAHILATSVHELAQKVGIENLGFLTLTFAHHIVDPKLAQKRLNSLLSHVIKPRYGDYVGVMERQKSSRIHYHMLVVVGKDIRTGFNFDAVDKQDYSSANSNIRTEWYFWRMTAKKYGFGRTELMPVKSSAIAIARYIGKYISKSLEGTNSAHLQDLDKGVRLVRYSKGARAGTTRFTWVSNGAESWRRSVSIFADLVADHFGVCDPDISDLKILLGPRWAYNYRGYILAISDMFETIERQFPDDICKKTFFPQIIKNIKEHFNVGDFIQARS